jgi:hypothetical protein
VSDDPTSAVLAALKATGGELAVAPGVTGTLGLVVVTGTAQGDIKVRVRLLDGRLVEADAGAGPDPDLTLTLPSAEAGAIVAGALDPSVAFMRGRLKTAGDNGLLLGVLAAAAAPGFGAWLDGVTAAASAAPPVR